MGNVSSSNVAAGKPKIGGAIFTAPLGTELPTNATTELNEAFKSLGYISEDGVSNANTPENEDQKAWGGDIVFSSQTNKSDTFTFTLIESLNTEVLKTVYGDTNVTGNLETGITVRANSLELEEHAYIIEMILKGNTLKRIVIPKAKVTSIGEITYSDGSTIGYQVTLTNYPGNDGDTHKEYIVKKPQQGE